MVAEHPYIPNAEFVHVAVKRPRLQDPGFARQLILNRPLLPRAALPQVHRLYVLWSGMPEARLQNIIVLRRNYVEVEPPVDVMRVNPADAAIGRGPEAEARLDYSAVV